MIGQGLGLRFLVPLAVEVVERDPLADGDLYPGELLSSLLRTPQSSWAAQPELRDRLQQVILALKEVPEKLEGPIQQFWTNPA